MSGISLQSMSLRDLTAQAKTRPEAGNPGTNNCEEAAKARRSASEFEAILLSGWLDKMQQTIQILPGDDADAVRDNFQNLGIQTVGKAIADGGGIGIGKMIEKHLAPGCKVESPLRS